MNGRLSLSVVALLAVLAMGCTALSVASNTPIQYRTDYYLDGWIYPEPWAQRPPKGGRVFVVLNNTASSPSTPFTVEFKTPGSSYSVKIKSDTNVAKETDNNVDWVRCHAASSANRIVVSFHSSSEGFLSSLQQMTVKDGSGKTVASAGVKVPKASNDGFSVTYATQDASKRTMVVHLHNYAVLSAATVNRIIVNGREVSIPGGAITLAPGAHQVVTVSLNDNLKVAYVWTVEVLVTEGGQQRWIGNGGRLGHNSYMNLGWQHSDQCPYPSDSQKTFDSFTQVLGLNAFWGWGNCGSYSNLLTEGAQKGYKILMDASHADNLNMKLDSQQVEAVAAYQLGDEVDGKTSNIQPTWSLGQQVEEGEKDVITYQGGKTNSYIGKFAGIADIQGLDFYVAACAPHITPALTPMYLRGAYDYLRNARNNQMPLSFMGYTQGLCTKCWNEVPNANEVIVQIGDAIASGTKGLFVFMADIAAAGLPQYPQVGEVMKSAIAVGELIRTGDVEGAKVTTTDGTSFNRSSIVEVIAAPKNEFLVVAVNTDADKYSDLICLADPFVHWQFSSHTITRIVAEVNTEFGTSPKNIKVEEARGGQVTSPQPPVSAKYDPSTKVITLENVEISASRPLRLLKITLE